MAAIAFTTPTCVRAWIEYPFQERGDFTTKIYHHIMQVERDSYAPLAWNDVMTTADEKPTRSPFADDSAAYYVGDTEPQNTDPRMVEFDRMFANIPQTVTEGNGVYAFNYPGVDSTVTDTIATSTANESATYDSGTNEGIMIFDVATPGDFSVGQTITINNNAATNKEFETQYQGAWFPYIVSNAVVTDITGSTITAKEVLNSVLWTGFRSGVTITTFTAKNSLTTRSPFTRNSSSSVVLSYEKSDNYSDLSVSSPFEVLTSNREPTDTLTSTTIPSKLTYLNYISSSSTLNAEPTKIQRWMGNIWERQQIVVKAL